MKEILAETEAMLARGKMDLPISLLFAASRGDDMLLQQLLKKGSDPNEPDKNGKTALVSKYYFLYFEHIHICLYFIHVTILDSYNSTFTCNSILQLPKAETIV